MYPDLYLEIFSEIDVKQLPSYIYMGWHKKEYVGFMSAYLHNIDEVYLQYAGFNDKHKGHIAVGLFREVVEYVHRDYRVILCRIENTNISALKVAMNTGFLIIGIRCLNVINGIRIFVELLKNKEDNHG